MKRKWIWIAAALAAPLAERILAGAVAPGASVTVDVTEGQLSFR